MNPQRIARSIARKAGLGKILRSAQRQATWPPNGAIRYGSFRRVTPVGTKFGDDRGTPLDRFYIERFLSSNAGDIKGSTLEIAESKYTKLYGGEKVTLSDVLHVSEGAPNATVIADLTDAPVIADDKYDCVILTQTLQFIFDIKAAIDTLHRIVKPGGVVLATLPGISQVSRYDMDRWGDYWRFTDLAANKLFSEVFGSDSVSVEAHGNVLAAITFLEGLPAEMLKQEELEQNDPDYQLITTVRAVKSA